MVAIAVTDQSHPEVDGMLIKIRRLDPVPIFDQFNGNLEHGEHGVWFAPNSPPPHCSCAVYPAFICSQDMSVGGDHPKEFFSLLCPGYPCFFTIVVGEK